MQSKHILNSGPSLWNGWKRAGFLLIILLAVISASCTKTSESRSSFILRWNPVNVRQYHDTTIILRIKIDRSANWGEEKINVKVYSPSPLFKVEEDSWNYIPDTIHDFKVTCNTSMSGSYAFRVVATAPTGGQTIMNTLYIAPTNDCVYKLLGTYTNTANGQPTEVTLGRNTKEIVVKNLLWNAHPSSSALDTLTFNCPTGSLSRITHIGPVTYTATGSVSGDTIKLNTTVHDENGDYHYSSYSLGR